jgi:cyanophycin synthetase
MVASMADFCPGSVTFFAPDPHHPIIATRRAQGHRVVYVEDGKIVACRGQFEQRLPLDRIPITRNGSIGFQVENTMAAIAAAWALGISWKVIVNGLSTFISDANTVPGRFNLFDYRGATVIADYGHNPDAILALVKAVEAMPATRRSVVISGAGDRRDDDIRRQTQILGGTFDRVVLYEDQCQRGRADGEVLTLLREGLANAKRTSDIREIRGEFLAIDTALGSLESGDLCLILIDQVDAALGHIKQRIAAG